MALKICCFLCFVAFVVTLAIMASMRPADNVGGFVGCLLICLASGVAFVAICVHMTCPPKNAVAASPGSPLPQNRYEVFEGPTPTPTPKSPPLRDPELAAPAECPVCFSGMQSGSVELCPAIHNGTQCGFAVCTPCKGRMSCCPQCRTHF